MSRFFCSRFDARASLCYRLCAAQAAAAAFLTVSASAEPVDLSAELESIRAEADVPGLAACVFSSGEILATGAAGMRARGDDDEVTVDDPWHIGSITKSMTATLAAILVEDGVIEWDSTIADVFDDGAVRRIDPGYRDVTLAQLLRHRGGVPADVAPDLWGRLYEQRREGRKERLELVRETLAAPPASEPGAKYEYSNTGYTVAGAMLEEASGELWEDLMRERLFKPLGMESAGFGAPDGRNAPRGHRQRLPVNPGRGADNPPAIGPAGTVHCSVLDLAKFGQFHLAAGKSESAPADLLGPESFSRLQSPENSEDYALGWSVASRGWAGGGALTHSGSNTMWFAVIWLAPEKDFGVAVAANEAGDHAAKACDKAASLAIERFAAE